MNDIVSQFEKLQTTCVSDAMQGLNNLSSTIKPLEEKYKIAGRAFTIKMPAGDNKVFLQAISEAKAGDILVVDAKGDTYNAIAGDFVIGMMKILGIKGLVVDGVVRDILRVKQVDFPVFCKGTTAAASHKYGVGEINIPISCGGVSVCPGDIIVGDADGVVVVPRDIAEEVLIKSQEKAHKDQLREEEVLQSVDTVRKYLSDFLKK
jgi:regulator of RNase E activity RraA